MTEFIRGKYEPRLGGISIDYGSHIFDDPTGTIFHEQTHYYLSNYTNHGAVFNALSAITAREDRLKVDLGLVKSNMVKLYNSMYFVQEGFAHLLQAKNIQESDGLVGVNQLVHAIPPKPRVALVDLLFTLNLTKDQFTKFTEKASLVALHTDLHQRVIEDPDFILNDASVSRYLSEVDNNPNERLKKLRVAVEKDPSLLDLDLPELCVAVGINYTSPMSNKEKAEMINVVTGMTEDGTSLVESDIRTLETTNDVFLPSYETMVIRDANLEARAYTKVLPHVVLGNLAKLRTLYIYNNPESPQPDGHFGYYAFLAPRFIVNSCIPIADSGALFGVSAKITRIVDTHAYDFNVGLLKREREFANPHIVWYKSFQDFRNFIEMVQIKKKIVSYRSFTFTEGSLHHFFLFRIEGESNLLHILPSMPFMHAKLAELGYIDKPLIDLMGDDAMHVNNFMHDLMGLPHVFNVAEMFKDPEAALESVQLRIKVGIGRNDPCVCGSSKKWKNCHGHGSC